MDSFTRQIENALEQRTKRLTDMVKDKDREIATLRALNKTLATANRRLANRKANGVTKGKAK